MFDAASSSTAAMKYPGGAPRQMGTESVTRSSRATVEPAAPSRSTALPGALRPLTVTATVCRRVSGASTGTCGGSLSTVRKGMRAPRSDVARWPARAAVTSHVCEGSSCNRTRPSAPVRASTTAPPSRAATRTGTSTPGAPGALRSTSTVSSKLLGGAASGASPRVPATVFAHPVTTAAQSARCRIGAIIADGRRVRQPRRPV